MFNKSKILWLMIIVIVLNIACITAWKNVSGDAKEIKVKIVKYNSKVIKIKLTNLSKKHEVMFYPGFNLKKLKNNKWKSVKFLPKQGVFAKTNILDIKESKIITIKWKKYFGKNLSKGKYKIKLVKSKRFRIK